MDVILHGIILAFGLILPLGVQNVFIFTQGATQHTRRKAIPAVVTAAACDTLLILIAIFGLSFILLQHETLRTVVMSVGIFFLLYMAYSIWHATPSMNMNEEALSTKKQIMFAASVSILNPHALLDIVGVIGTSALAYDGTKLFLFATACIIVSWIWFFALMLAGSYLKTLRHAQTVLVRINKCSALFIVGMALYLAIGLF
ncbi:LysE/ArgO family amino acid transporter [Caryophanon latum]|uniref:Lysine transporter LysE n=1 Tax=Caryophanon latum TaxID=33977 RepID=A0A1C0YTV0_9BACL|nr:LysE family transporter [Caryophanon latum]OCS90583.1 lysine transporter LysE [Caryophanon latum]